ncbi:MAG TPA: hypothetical protein VIM11_28105 [Tepidisphaeraceae bacterium]|jgi:hypothetical protein
MRAPTKAADLSSRVSELQEQRQQHLEAVEKISATLAEIERLVGGAGNGAPRRGRPPGRPKASGGSAIGAEAVGRSGGRGKKRTRGRFEITGEDSIIGFIKTHRNPTTQDVKKHWASEGRGGTADNALSKLVSERKIRRIPMVGQRGSTYSV